ncbi:MAG: PIG-L family deacetylase [Methyloprofundus sp.]|nr:PIG-L family deacetylase [Methyloprofundus sp.]
MSQKVIVVALHPDDETLGAGGTLLKHKADGCEVHWLICTEMKVEDGFDPKVIEKREQEIKKVSELYDFNSVYRLGLSTMMVDTYSMKYLVALVSDVFGQIKPNIVYLPFKSDVHSDHKVMFEAVYSCTKVFRYPFVKKILMMETPSETDYALSTKEDCFAPNVFTDISSYIQKKMEIMAVYESEIAEHPFPRSLKNIKALARVRGSSSGCEFAESFMLLKEIN